MMREIKSEIGDGCVFLDGKLLMGEIKLFIRAVKKAHRNSAPNIINFPRTEIKFIMRAH